MSFAKRVLAIYERFLKGEELSTVKLSKIYEVDRKTIENTFKAIADFLGKGSIIYDRTIKKWRLKNRVTLLLTHEEIVTLNIIEQAAKERGEEFYTVTMKLLSKFRKNLHNSIYNHIDTENIDAIKVELAVANSAVINRQKLKLIYKDKVRVVKPLRLANFDGYWYLILKDGDDRIKSFYFKDISDISLLDENFILEDLSLDRILHHAINAYFKTDITPYEVKLFIKSDIAYIFKRKPISKSQRLLKEYKDGSMEIALLITNDMEIIPTLQRYIPYIYVIEDDENAKRIVKILKGNLKNYLKEI